MNRHYLKLVCFVVFIVVGVTYLTNSGAYAADGASLSVEPSQAEYDKTDTKIQNVVVTIKDGRTLAAIKQGPFVLRRNTDYSVASNKITIRSNYLREQLTGGHETYPIELTFEFTEGPPENLSITIKDDPTKMKLKGNIIVNHSVGTPYHDQGVNCINDSSGQPENCNEADVTEDNKVNEKLAGKYLVTFKHTNGDVIVRMVNVLPLSVTAISNEAGEISVYNAEPNATLIVYDESEQRIEVGKANKDGEYTFKKIPIGNYYVVQIFRDIESQKSNLVKVSGPDAPFLIGSTGGVGTLKVTNATPNSQVKLFNSSDKLITTIRANKDGEAEFKNVPVGTGYYVIVSHNGVDGVPSNKVDVGGVNAVSISGNDSMQTIDVRNAAPDATLKLYDRFDKVVATGKADKEGNFVFTKVSPGTGYYVIQTYNRNDSPKSNLVTITAVPLRTVNISVAVGKSEINVEGAEESATLTLYDGTGKEVMTGKADKSGKYVFKNVPAGNNYYVIQSLDGRESSASKKVNVIGDSVVFEDVQNTWAEQQIIALVNAGAINGYPDGTFRPNKTITRAEFVTVLIKALDIESKNGKEFVDMRNHWARNAVTTAAGRGIIPNNQSRFNPDKAITREEMAYMIVKAKRFSSKNTKLTFRDENQISLWAKDEVKLAVQNRIVFGYNDGSFRPRQTATRAEAATMIYRALND